MTNIKKQGVWFVPKLKFKAGFSVCCLFCSVEIHFVTLNNHIHDDNLPFQSVALLKMQKKKKKHPKTNVPKAEKIKNKHSCWLDCGSATSTRC